MRVLVTSSRFPFALCAVRRFGEEGHAVYAADTFGAAPGSHSRHVVRRFVTAPPAFEADRYVDEIAGIVREHAIDVIIPAFEEALYLAERREHVERAGRLFAPPLGVLLQLHDKGRFAALARALGIEVPRTFVATSVPELQAAIAELPEWIVKPAFSRGGIRTVTNTGPLAGWRLLEHVVPTPAAPWIVQEFVHGTEVCCFSVARRGRVVAHSAYEHPKMIEHSGGILFESIDGAATLAIAERVCEALAYEGQISFDLVRTPRGLVVLECNPRPTAGVFMMRARDLCEAVLDEAPRGVRMVPPGVRRQIAGAIARDVLRNPRELGHDLRILFSGIADVYSEGRDLVPALYTMLSYSRVREYRRWAGQHRRDPTDLVAAQFFDVLWDGHEGARP